MKQILLTIMIFAVLLSAQSTEYLQLQVGKSLSLPSSEGQKVTGLRGCKCVNYKVLESGGIVLTGAKAGNCLLELPFQQRYINLNVYAAPSEVALQELQLLLPEIYDQALNMVEIGGRLLITGNLDNPLDVIKYYRFLQLHGNDSSIVDLVNHTTPTIAIEVKIYEVSRSSMLDYDPMSGLSAVGKIDYSSTDFSSNTEDISIEVGVDLLSILEFMVSKGDAKIIARPVITVLHGDSATYHVGGEAPYIVSTANNIEVDYRPYGLIIDIVPRLLMSGLTQLDIGVEFSKIDQSISVGSVPGFLTRSFHSVMLLHDGETSILAGLNYEEIQKTKRYIPLLGWVMPFLFFSYASNVEEREIYIAITPTTDPNKVYNMDAFPKVKKHIEGE